MQHLGMSRISHAQEDPGRRTVPRIDLSPTPRSETVLPMLQRRPGGFDINEVLEAYPSLFKPSGTDSMLLGSSPVFLLRSPVFLRGTEQLQFARNHVRWNRQQWRNVTFSDESRFCPRLSDGRLRVWRRYGERHAEVNVQPRHAYNGGSVMVWAGVTADRRTDLVVVPGILTGQRYIDEILRPHVVPFLRPVGNNGIFQDDNARPHRARIVDGFLQANNVRRLEWPTMSPDLSCIEHVWDVLGRAVQKRMPEHSTMADLRRVLGEEWQRIPQATIRKLVFSTRKRLIECRDNRGGYTHY